ncbi:pre-rRNA processing and 40S ribosomal subunit assembly [Parahypoxylon ruwenzoriense]
MATVLGKRKSRSQKSESSVSREEAQAIFRRHFEAQFAPLEPSDTALQKEAAPGSDPEDLRSDSESEGSDVDNSWDGFSGSESDSVSSPTSTTAAEIVEVVSHTSALPALPSGALSKRESKAYLSSRPPSSSVEASSAATAAMRKTGPATADEDAPSLLKNDLELQRLLSESHLFSSVPGGQTGNTEHTGRNRHLATDLRLAALGSKASIYKQVKMPMAHRKGIAAAAEARETKRRKEARENGIVLERPTTKGKVTSKDRRGPSRRRERPVDAPAVGRMRNGMLKLSQKDIASIQDNGMRASSRGGKKRRR